MDGEQREQERDPRAQAEIREFLERRLASLDVIATTVTRSGQVIDWVPLESQAPAGLVEAPPPLPMNPAVDQESLVHFELEDQPEAQGPDGTVPVPRPDPDDVYSPGGVQGLLTKYGPFSNAEDEGGPDPQVGRLGHDYAGASDSRNNYGGRCILNIWNPFTAWDNNMSLSQLCPQGGLAGGRQTVEAGWLKYRNVTGDWSPHLFTYFTTNDYTITGDDKGGYNQMVKGWVQVSRTRFPNALLIASEPGGTQTELDLAYLLGNGGWWLWVYNEWIGYYPSLLFASSGIGDSAASIAFYGETADTHLGGTKGLQMGSGRFPSDPSYGRVAYQRNLAVYTTPDGNSPQRFSPSDTRITNPFFYMLDMQYKNTGPWESFCYFGGPGGPGAQNTGGTADTSSATVQSESPA